MGLASLGLAPFIGFLQAREHGRERHELDAQRAHGLAHRLLNHTAFQERLTAELDEAAEGGPRSR